LGSGVNDINFMESNGMDNFLSLLEFTLWALDVSSLWSTVVKVTASSERSSELGDFTGGFINSDDVTGHDLLFLD
jgi:hypothetical protein